jgi:hypothetical protein
MRAKARGAGDQVELPENPPASADASQQQDVVVRVEKDGKQVVILRRYEGARGAVVECDVFPVDTMRIEPLRPGPYLFTSPEPASRFIEEVLLSLEYLGCTIN